MVMMRCVWCNHLLADSWAGYRAHYEHFHPDIDPETGRKKPPMSPKERRRQIVDRVERRIGKKFFITPSHERN